MINCTDNVLVQQWFFSLECGFKGLGHCMCKYVSTQTCEKRGMSWNALSMFLLLGWEWTILETYNSLPKDVIIMIIWFRTSSNVYCQ